MRKTLDNSGYYFRCLHGIIDSIEDHRPNRDGDYTPLCGREWFKANKDAVERNTGVWLKLDRPGAALDTINFYNNKR